MRLILALATMALALIPATAGAAILHATPSTFSQTWTDARGGDTILLGAGAYSAWSPTTKGSLVTLTPEDGAKVTMAGATFNGSANITVQGVQYTKPVGVLGVSTNINFDRDTFDNLGTGANEGRLGYLNGSTGTVSNSHFGGGGCSDGIQISGGGGPWPHVMIKGNEFANLRQGSCGPHVDAIQFYGGTAEIIDNYVHDVSTGVMSYDSNGDMPVVKNNVFVGDEYAVVFLGGGLSDSQITHNVAVGRPMQLDGGHQGIAPTNNVIRDNIAQINVIGGSGNLVDHNLLPSQATFVGGSGRCAYATRTPKGTASDGTDIGLNDCVTQPPPDTTPPQTSITQQPVDGVSTDAAVAFTADEPSTFACSLDSAPFAPCTSPVSYSALSVGGHVFAVRATDTAGNVDATPATASWTVVAPAGCDQACEDAYKAQIASLQSLADSLRSKIAAALSDLS